MGINVKRIGHVGFLVSDFEESFKFYTEAIGCTITHRTKRPNGSETAFLRFDEDHHNIVIATAPPGVDVSADGQPVRLIQQIALEVDNRDEFFRALAHLRSKGVEPVSGPWFTESRAAATLAAAAAGRFTSWTQMATGWRFSATA